MSSKKNPGKFDCYAAAAPDEEMFHLLARDPTAPGLVEIWRQVRAGNIDGARQALEALFHGWQGSGKKPLPIDSEKSLEAAGCATRMVTWKRKNPKA